MYLLPSRPQDLRPMNGLTIAALVTAYLAGILTALSVWVWPA